MTISFVLPDGLCLSGAVTWSIELGKRLSQSGRSVTLVKHPDYGPRLSLSLPDTLQIVHCRNTIHPNDIYITASDVIEYAEDYRSVLPAAVVPNWSPGAFAACAYLSQEDPTRLRVIGMAHADEAYYYHLLEFYEPLIHRFIAVSDEIAANLRTAIPHRAQDILVRPYAVRVPDSLNRSYSSGSEPLQIMYAGRLVEQQKRVSDLIKLARRLLQGGLTLNCALWEMGRIRRG
jgi:hypothetical protein